MRIAQQELPAMFAELAKRRPAMLWREGIARRTRSTSTRTRPALSGRRRAARRSAEPADGDWLRAFAAEHQQLYGYVHPNGRWRSSRPRVEATGRAARTLPPSQSLPRSAAMPAASRPRCTSTARASTRPSSIATQLAAGRPHRRAGDRRRSRSRRPSSTPAGRPTMLSGGELLLRRRRREADSARRSSRSDRPPIRCCSRSSTTSSPPSPSRWGITLRNTSSSVNVKERLDFSCAIFTPTGDLVVNAPHIPVHLGAMGETVRSVIARQSQPMRARRRVRDERSLSRRLAPAGRHRRHAGASTRRASSCSSPPAARTTPRSAASRPARCRRSRRTWPKKAC